MTGMEHAIESATQGVRPVMDGHGWVLWGTCECGLDLDGDLGTYRQSYNAHVADVAARALAEAGLLNPAPLQEAQAEAWDECSQWHAEQGMPVYGAGNEHNPYRAEGDGRDVTHE